MNASEVFIFETQLWFPSLIRFFFMLSFKCGNNGTAQVGSNEQCLNCVQEMPDMSLGHSTG